ncbi:MAG: TIGR02206 family membrane protein [Fusobacteriaceae bacterium]|jgi:hypothetical integral membrane protein (TIGR02206 family)|nr:TIGR02206 family membrane protein [Fusobacteriaceae bacterium]
MQEAFKLFGAAHILMMVLGIVGVVVALFLSNVNYRLFPKILAVLILMTKVGELAYRHTIFHEPITNLLPLHLCNISLLLAIAVILFESKFLFQLLYYWSVGAVFAILTPEVKVPVTNFVSMSFFATHFFILYAPLCCIFIYKMKPTKSGLWASFVALNLLCVAVYFINRKLGTNFMYINGMPDFKSPLQFMGKWPYYIIGMEVLFLLLAHLMAIPFRKPKRSQYFYRR